MTSSSADAPSSEVAQPDEPAKPSIAADIARFYNYATRGKEDLASTRTVFQNVVALLPQLTVAAQANADFVLRAVAAAADAGITQFLDLGCGFPRDDRQTVATVARQRRPQARVVYVDNDPMVACHGRALLAGPQGAWLVEADARDVPAVLREAGRHLDFDQPTAVIMAALVHFWPDHEDPYNIVDAYLEAFPSGWLIFTHACADLLSFQQRAKALTAYAPIAPLYLRSKEAITAFLDERTVLEPGLIEASLWRPDDALLLDMGDAHFLAAVAAFGQAQVTVEAP
ncbi:SAM-dependent methyltransferase [Nonomuraea endophytica]|uniref:SAM-dependent methyltransferase n=1 Tax=Nonomuraea endophytica TaxID=714136 RepID=UPI0037C9529B